MPAFALHAPLRDICIPLRAADAAPDRRRHGRGRIGEAMEQKKLLLVDDEADVTRILAKRLTRRGYDCTTAGNGQEALAAMRQFPYSIVVMDVKMPVMDGIAALQAIRAQWPGTQVILLSGHADMQLAVQAMSDGAFGYLMKPVELEELLFNIEDAAAQYRLEAGQAHPSRPVPPAGSATAPASESGEPVRR